MKNLIIIPCLNHWAFTQICLESVLKRIDLSRDEVLVFDNGSTDNTQPGLVPYLDKITVHREEANIGVYNALNVTKDRYLRDRNLVIVANDHIVMDRWLEHLLAGEDVYGPGIYSPMVIDTGITPTLLAYQRRRNDMRKEWFNGKPEAEKNEMIWQYMIALYATAGGMKRFRNTVIHEATADNKAWQAWPGLTFISSKVMKTVGYYCESFGMYGAADVDFFYRAKAYGFPCRVLRTDYAHHFGSITLRKAGVGYTDLKDQDYAAALKSNCTEKKRVEARARAASGINRYLYKGEWREEEIK